MGSLKCQSKGCNVIHKEQEIWWKSILHSSTADLCGMEKSETSMSSCQGKSLGPIFLLWYWWLPLNIKLYTLTKIQQSSFTRLLGSYSVIILIPHPQWSHTRTLVVLVNKSPRTFKILWDSGYVGDTLVFL